MHDGLATREGALQSLLVEEVDPLGADVGAALAQLPHDVAAHEAGRARDVDLHPPAASARRTRPSAMTGQTSR